MIKTKKYLDCGRKYYIVFQNRYGNLKHGYWNGSYFVKEESRKKLYSSFEEAENIESDMIWAETLLFKMMLNVDASYEDSDKEQDYMAIIAYSAFKSGLVNRGQVEHACELMGIACALDEYWEIEV